MTTDKPYINDVSDIEIQPAADDHIIIRLNGPRGWTSCRIRADRFLTAIKSTAALDTRSLAETCGASAPTIGEQMHALTYQTRPQTHWCVLRPGHPGPHADSLTPNAMRWIP